jgi:hypothetical protein
MYGAIMKKLFTTLSIILYLSSALYAKETVSVVDAINQQKVLLQQILKEYAFSGMGNNYKNSKIKLKAHLESYQVKFTQLEKTLKSSKALVALKKSKKIWSDIQKDFKKKASKDKVLILQGKTDKILQEMNTLMTLVLDKKKKGNHDIINISSYQGVIIERMAALYMLKTWGVSDPKFDFKMKESITFFNNSLYKMLESPSTSDTNKQLVKKVMRSFKFFEVMNRSKTKFIPTLIYAKTIKIHKQIKTITQTYIEEGK